MKVFSIFPAGFIYLCDIIDAGAVSEQALRNIIPANAEIIVPVESPYYPMDMIQAECVIG